MAALVNQSGKDSSQDVAIKAVEIQAATHVEIISVGNDVFQKNNEKQWEQFNTKLKKHELDLIQILEGEKKAALEQLRLEHEMNIEKLKLHYNDMMDNALKEEAERMRDIMDKIATTSLEEERLEGQRKLDESLKKAREDFDVEKAEAIIQVTLEHEKKQKIREKQLEDEHKANIEKITNEWKEKLKVQARKELLNKNETLEYEKEAAKKRFDVRLEEALREQGNRHEEEVARLNQCIENEKLEGVRLQNEIQSLNDSIDKKKQDLKNVLAAFQKFVDQTPGFSPGQSEFILDNLVPEGFDEFVSSSD